MVLFNMVIGDLTGEGHRASQSFQIECIGGSLREVRKAHYESIKGHRINIEKVCDRWDDIRINDDIRDYAEELVVKYFPKELNTINEEVLTPEDMALLWAAIIMDTNNDLKLSFIYTDEEITRTLNTMKKDHLGRYIGSIGFATFH